MWQRRAQSVLQLRWNGKRLLVIGHAAARWGLDHFIRGVPLEELAVEDFAWQQRSSSACAACSRRAYSDAKVLASAITRCEACSSVVTESAFSWMSWLSHLPSVTVRAARSARSRLSM